MIEFKYIASNLSIMGVQINLQEFIKTAKQQRLLSSATVSTSMHLNPLINKFKNNNLSIKSIHAVFCNNNVVMNQVDCGKTHMIFLIVYQKDLRHT